MMAASCTGLHKSAALLLFTMTPSCFICLVGVRTIMVGELSVAVLRLAAGKFVAGMSDKPEGHLEEVVEQGALQGLRVAGAGEALL